MSPVAKIFVVLNLVLAVAFLGAAATFLGWDDWNSNKRMAVEKSSAEQVAALNSKIKEWEGRAKTAEDNEKAATNQKTEAQTQSAGYKASYDQMKKSYDELNAAAGAATRALVIAQNTIKEGRTLTDQLQSERQKLIDELRRAEDEKRGALQAQSVAELGRDKAETELKATQAKLSSTEESLQRKTFELTSMVKKVPGAGGGAAQPQQTGKVLLADDAANVVVISLGSEDAVQVGYQYTISRGSQFVGIVEITHVEGRQAAGRSLKDLQKSPMMRGDDVATR